ncbi:MAG: chemotaxis protein [Epsilonproteobacteria bacterium]|nr:MAG: chemotaxis protein [Campylobacterota bacterium]
MNIFNKLTIKFKVLLTSGFAIFYLLLFTLGSNYSSSTVQITFDSMNNSELFAKNKIQNIVNNISKMNKLVMVASIAEEVTKETINQTINYNKLILDDILSLKNLAKKQNNKRLEKKMQIIEKRYTSFYSIASNLHKAFKTDFDDGIDEIIGLDAISTKMGSELDQLSLASENNFKGKITKIYELMEFSNNATLIISFTAIILFIVFSILIISSITNSINNFKSGLIEFFDYLNKKSKTAKMLNDTNKDEIGLMAKVVNKNIKTIEKNMDDDKHILENLSHVVDCVSNGDLTQRVTANTSNLTLQELVTVINNMIGNVHHIIIHSLETLKHYEEQNFKATTTIKCSGELYDLMSGIDNLGNAISLMLVDNKHNGVVLQNNSVELLQNVDKLNKNSTQTATSLQETVASLEKITSNISENTKNIVKISDYSNNITTSASAGEQLATQTTSSMDEINTEVTAISDAISVIDQIAFQTNILSLNAAVEAATAGEAGKGFAVVAQEVRNLASRSADAATEIKTLVERASAKAKNGKNISNQMIDGYDTLKNNINQTFELIKNVEKASKEQNASIEQINNTINSLDQQTQQNASIANTTNRIAKDTTEMANKIVQSADEKEFTGKDSINI